jgi:hypothetical protein
MKPISPFRPRRRRLFPWPLKRLALAAAALLGLGLYSGQFTSVSALNPLSTSCNIKGNVSSNGRIYHLPGQRYYSATRINPLNGERWFCSEAEARAAGWRRSRV